VAARLFAAADLPGDVRAELAAFGAAAVQERPGELRAVPEANLHLTLVFLGDREEAEVDRLGALVAAQAAGPVEVVLGDGLWLAPRRPHVLTVAIEDRTGALRALQAAVLDVLVREAGHVVEARMFRPHVTVARVRRGARVSPEAVRLPAPPRGPFALPSVTLYRSRPGRGGSAYEAVARAPLTGAGCRP
jgi:2'-5' RNA ligase